VQLRRDKRKYAAAGVQIVLVGLGTPDKARQFRKDLDLPFTVLCDPAKTSYQAFGLTRRMQLSREARLQGVVQVIGDLARYGGAITDQDMVQLGGVFIVDRTGRIRFAYTALRAADRPTLADVLAAGPFT
jgi:peroxiredoxin